MSYQSQSSDLVQGVQLKVQKLVLTNQDLGVLAVSGSTVIIDVAQPLAEVRAALHIDNSAGTLAPVVAASRAISGNQVTLTLAAAFAANDCLILEYVVSE